MALSLRVVSVAIGGALLATACATSPAPDRDHETLVAAERAFARHASDARLYREGPPVSGADALRAAIASMHPLAFEPAGGDMASSGDLAYTYGAWRSAAANGHYVHLWTRDARGAWKIAVALRL